jgi:hypothetical protein
MEVRLKDKKIDKESEEFKSLSEILPPPYSDILIQKCLQYYEKVFGQSAKEELTQILTCAGQKIPPKCKTYRCVTYNNHIYIGELDAKGKKA